MAGHPAAKPLAVGSLDRGCLVRNAVVCRRLLLSRRRKERETGLEDPDDIADDLLAAVAQAVKRK